MEITDNLLPNLDLLGNWGILTTDADLRITGWNRWLEKHSGKQASELIGQQLFSAYPDLIERSLDRYYPLALAGQASMLSQRFHKYLLPLPPTLPDASVMHMQQTARVSPITQGDVVCGTLTLIEDVTERVLTEHELRQQAERLEEANRHKDEFLAMLAHELRNPLAPIQNGVRLLDAGLSSEEARQTREMIDRQVTHMSRLIDDLLDVSRIARGKVRLQTNNCDLMALLRDVARDFKPILADSGLRLIVDVPSEPCWITGDAIRLTQVVANLLHNANKFTNQGGEVGLSAQVREHEREVVIQISDTGIGMSRDTMLRVFDTFSQADISLARSKGGLGLGLALVKGLTELHHGKVEARSDGIGRGSTFVVTLPLTNVSVPSQQADDPLLTAPRPIRSVLIIEDNQDTALSLRLLLKRLKFVVEVAYSGPEGVELAREFRPDAVLCDIGLPGLDGYAVARSLRSDPSTCDAYLIAQSGYGQTEDVRKSHDAGFNVHLTKPVDFQQLYRILGQSSPAAPGDLS